MAYPKPYASRGPARPRPLPRGDHPPSPQAQGTDVPICDKNVGREATMAARKDLGRDLRALCAMLAVICLLGAGVAYGATRYLQTELEADATRDARKLTMDVLRPLLPPRDATAPIRAARYEELLDSVRERGLAGAVVGAHTRGA